MSYNENQNGTVANSNNATITANGVGTKDKPKRSYKKEAVYDVLDTAMRQFKRQITKNNDTKRDCILANIGKRYPDTLRFWMDFNKEVEQFTDSIRFNEFCKSKGHDARQVAEHIIADGKTFKNRVLSEGFHKIEQMAYMFNGNLFVDTERIFDKYKQMPTT